MSDRQQNSRQIVQGALRGAAVGRVAVGPLAVHYCAGVAGVSIRQYTTDAQVLADCVVQYYERFHPDAVWISADTWITAEAMGAAVEFPGDNQPMGGTAEPRVRTACDIDNIPPPDPTSCGRYPLMIEAVRRVRGALGSDVFIVACFDQYPFSLACALMGIDTAMVKLIDDRPLVEAVMRRGLEYGLAYGRALADAGADMLSGGDSPAGLIGPRLYCDVALKAERHLITQLKGSVSQPVSLHICGNVTPILREMASSGADVLELDHPVDLSDACRMVGSEVAIWGNLDPVGVLAQGNPQEVCRATRRVLQDVEDCGHRRFVLSSGCTLAMETPPENLREMFDIARTFGDGSPSPTVTEDLSHGH